MSELRKMLIELLNQYRSLSVDMRPGADHTGTIRKMIKYGAIKGTTRRKIRIRRFRQYWNELRNREIVPNGTIF